MNSENLWEGTSRSIPKNSKIISFKIKLSQETYKLIKNRLKNKH